MTEENKKVAPTCMPVHSTADLPTGRRCFLAQAGTVVLASAAIAPAVLAAASTVLTPVKKHLENSKAQSEGGDVKEYPVGTFAELPEDGTPLLVSIRDELVDGWSKEVNVVGAIYARRVGDGVKVLHTMCPHMGSTVGLKKDEKMFFCPSHSAWFDLDGKRLEIGGAKNPCKRDMDELEARVAEDGTILVQFCCFKSDSAEKIQV